MIISLIEMLEILNFGHVTPFFIVHIIVKSYEVVTSVLTFKKLRGAGGAGGARGRGGGGGGQSQSCYGFFETVFYREWVKP